MDMTATSQAPSSGFGFFPLARKLDSTPPQLLVAPFPSERWHDGVGSEPPPPAGLRSAGQRASLWPRVWRGRGLGSALDGSEVATGERGPLAVYSSLAGPGLPQWPPCQAERSPRTNVCWALVPHSWAGPRGPGGRADHVRDPVVEQGPRGAWEAARRRPVSGLVQPNFLALARGSPVGQPQVGPAVPALQAVRARPLPPARRAPRAQQGRPPRAFLKASFSATEKRLAFFLLICGSAHA